MRNFFVIPAMFPQYLIRRCGLIDPDDENRLEAYSGWENLPAVFDVEPNREYYVRLRDQ